MKGGVGEDFSTNLLLAVPLDEVGELLHELDGRDHDRNDYSYKESI